MRCIAGAKLALVAAVLLACFPVTSAAVDPDQCTGGAACDCDSLSKDALSAIDAERIDLAKTLTDRLEKVCAPLDRRFADRATLARKRIDSMPHSAAYVEPRRSTGFGTSLFEGAVAHAQIEEGNPEAKQARLDSERAQLESEIATESAVTGNGSGQFLAALVGVTQGMLLARATQAAAPPQQAASAPRLPQPLIIGSPELEAVLPPGRDPALPLLPSETSPSGMKPVAQVVDCLQYELEPIRSNYKYFRLTNRCAWGIQVYVKVTVDGQWNSYHDVNGEIPALSSIESQGILTTSGFYGEILAVCPSKSAFERQIGAHLTGMYTSYDGRFGCWTMYENQGVGTAQ